MNLKKKLTITNIVVLFFVLIIVLPVVLMLVWTVTERWAWPDLFPQVFSMRALREILGRRGMLARLFLSSILISAIVALLSVVTGALTARALVLYEFRGKSLIYFLTILPFMVPATVFAMGVQITFIKIGLNNTAAGVILAHLICSLPYAVRLLMDGTVAVGRKLEEQARVLGVSVRQAFIRVTLPVLAPVILSAFSMAYIVSFSQYFLTLLIGGGQVKTFTIVMVPYLQSGNRNIACAYSVVFVGITLAVFTVFEKIAERWSKNMDTEFYV
jgi:putative spermidine/putrescine transport system permease protein